MEIGSWECLLDSVSFRKRPNNGLASDHLRAKSSQTQNRVYKASLLAHFGFF